MPSFNAAASLKARTKPSVAALSAFATVLPGQGKPFPGEDFADISLTLDRVARVRR